MFFGTPHRGASDYASWGQLARSIAGVVCDTSPTLLAALDSTVDTGELEELREDFNKMLGSRKEGKFCIQSFQESEGMVAYHSVVLIVGHPQVVPNTSSGLDNEWEVKESINANHLNMCRFSGKDDPEYQKVKDVMFRYVDELLEESRPNPEAPFWTPSVEQKAKTTPDPFLLVPFERNKDVVGRDHIFCELDKKLPLIQNYQSAALWGLGGSGKTQIALEYAYRRREKTSCSVFWVHAGSAARFADDFARIAKLAGLSVEMKEDELLDAVRRWMEQQANWLLILDNADALTLFKSNSKNTWLNNDLGRGRELLRFVPRGSTGTILWTSRDKSIVGSLVSVQQGIKVPDQMEHSEALELLRSLVGRDIVRDSAATEDKLLEVLGRLPLAIAHAGAYIRRMEISAQAYLGKILESEERLSKLLDWEFVDRHRESDVPNSIMQTWLISMEQIAQENPYVDQILHTIAFFDNQGIPFKLLCAVAGNADEDEILAAVSRLQEFSFLHVQSTVDQDQPCYELHRLVQLATRRSLCAKERREQRQHFSEAAVRIMVEAFPDGTYGTWGECKTYLSHALRVSAWPEMKENKQLTANLLIKVSSYLDQQGRWIEAEEMAVRVVDIRKDELGEKHPDTLSAMGILAWIYLHQGRLREAKELSLQVVDLQKEVLGEKHPDTLQTLGNLAVTYWQQGRLREAEELNLRVVDLRKEVLGERHPITLFTMGELATNYLAQGRWREAEGLDLQVVGLRKEVLGEKHPETLRAIGNLAAIYSVQGRFREAEVLNLQVLDLRKEVLGEKHPDTLSTLGNLSVNFSNQGRVREADELNITVLDLRKEVLGEKHPDTLFAMDNLAATSLRQGQLREAEELSLRLVDLRKEVLKEKHPDTLSAMGNLARVYGMQGRWREAEELNLQVLNLQKETLGEKHPDTLVSVVEQAVIYSFQSRWREAEELSLQVVDLQKEVLGEKHPSTLVAMGNLATAYLGQGRLAEAEELSLRLWDLRKEVLRVKHPDTLCTMGELAVIYTRQGRLSEAVELNLQVVDIRKEVLGEKNPETLIAMRNLAANYKQQGRWSEAEQLERRVVNLRREALGEKHSNTLIAMESLAGILLQQGRQREAEELKSRISDLRKEALKEKRPE